MNFFENLVKVAVNPFSKSISLRKYGLLRFVFFILVFICFKPLKAQVKLLKMETKNLVTTKINNMNLFYSPASINESIATDSTLLSNNLEVINTTCRPENVIIPPGTHKAFVLEPDAFLVSISDLEKGERTGKILLQGYPVDMIINNSGTTISN